MTGLLTALIPIVLSGQFVIDPYRFEAAEANGSPGTTDLLAWWALEEASGTRADSHGSYTLSENSTPVNEAGIVGNAAFFDDGTFEYLYSAAFPNTFHGSDFTVGGWVRFDESAVFDTMMAQWLSTETDLHWRIFRDSSNNVYFTVRSSAASYSGVSDTAMPHNAWRFVVGRRSGTEIALFMNGVKQTSTATISGTVNTGDTDLRLGSHASGNFLTGNIDEAFVYTKALSDAQIEWLYNSGSGRSYAETAGGIDPGTANLVAYWELDDTSDSHGTFTLTNTGGVTFSAGVTGNAAEFDGTAKVLETSASLLSTTDDFSISMWIKMDVVPTSDYYIIHNAYADSGTIAWLIYRDDVSVTSGRTDIWKFIIWNQGATTYNTESLTGTANSTDWTHIVATYNQTTDIVGLYVNGVAADTFTTATATSIDGPSADWRVFLGASRNNPPDSPVDGLLDEVRIYDDTLTADEALYLYNLDKP